MSKRRRAVLIRVIIGVFAATFALQGAGIASAEETSEGGVTTEFIDAWEVVGNTLQLTVAGNSCTLTANDPTFSANKVYGYGSVSCTSRFPLLTLQVCLQARQAFVQEETTWQDIGCAATKSALNARFLEDTANANCLLGAAYYRTVTTAEGFNSENEKVMGGFIKSRKVLRSCGLA